MPKRPTRFEILIPQAMKEAEAEHAVEPPSSSYQVSGRFCPASWMVAPFSVSFALSRTGPAGKHRDREQSGIVR
jgi:hypothetical protein